MNKRIISILLAFILMVTGIPMTAKAGDAEEVYISISFDGQYITDKNNNPMAYVAVGLDELSAIDLNEYGLSDYLYDADGDGEHEITALHLYIYTHENIYGDDWSNVGVSGGAGSIFFERGLFGLSDCNLRYDYNGAYPAIDGWGVTADQLVLSDGDFIDVAGYTSWSFYWDSATGFHYFADENGNIVHSYTVDCGTPLPVKLIRTYSDMYAGGTASTGEAYYDVSYGTSLGNATGTVTTDDSGCANITFESAGTWYVWCDGGYGMENSGDIVSSPAYAKITVNTVVDPNQEAADEVIAKISNIGTVTLESESAITSARTAYDALTDAQKALVTNYETLTAAETALAQLKQAAADKALADETAANGVEELIDAIGTVNVHSGNKIREAREAYETLTDEQKAMVENIEVLTEAENALKELYVQAAKADHLAIYNATGKYISELGTPGVGSTGGEWMVIDLTRAGYNCPEGYYANVVTYVKENINSNEQLHRAKSTDNSRVILALTSAGYDVTDVDGHNLLMGLTDMTYVKKQGINGPIWALIAFDSHGYTIPANPNATEQVTRQGLISYILEKQLEDGGWALSGTVADPDMTGMAIQSLAPYYKTDAEVKNAVDKALELLSSRQLDNGGFGSVDGACSESCAQVVVALTSLGINPETDARFVKNGVSVLDAMCLFAVEGGGFAHIPNGGLNGMATEQSQYALVSYYRLLENKTSLYDMSDVTIRTNTKEKADEEAANAVEALIAAIGTVTKDSQRAIEEARRAYEELTDEQKALVENYDLLVAAEEKIKEIMGNSDPNNQDDKNDDDTNGNNTEQNPGISDTGNSPKTGDNNKYGICFILIFVSALGGVALWNTDRKRKTIVK